MSGDTSYVTWIIPNKVLYANWGEVITAETHAHLNATILAHLESGGVSVIGDFSHAKQFSVNAHEVAKHLSFTHSPCLAWMITVIENPTIRFIALLVANLTKEGGRYRTRKTLAEALELLLQLDPQLNPDQLMAFVPLEGFQS